ncbi:MAG: hypothetical protein AABZ60_06905, partial [Planctomycetota bacterium]
MNTGRDREKFDIDSLPEEFSLYRGTILQIIQSCQSNTGEIILKTSNELEELEKILHECIKCGDPVSLVSARHILEQLRKLKSQGIKVVSIPEQGQLVKIRSRQWVVNEVKPSTLPPPAMHVVSFKPQHLLTLSSVEDDGLGEEIQVVWEIEPGAKVIEKVALPDPTGFDAPEQLDAFLDAVRWGASSTADLKNIQSPFRSGIEIEDYQLDPVVRAIQMPRVNLLIADDVGLGKTIEAGMVALEL